MRSKSRSGHTLLFFAMLEWLYTGHTPRELSAAQLTEVLGLADHYTLEGLKHVCENVLVHSVEIDNACTLLRHADQYMAQELKQYCLAFILKNFDQVAYSDSFNDLSSNPMLLLEITRAAATKDVSSGSHTIRPPPPPVVQESTGMA